MARARGLALSAVRRGLLAFLGLGADADPSEALKVRRLPWAIGFDAANIVFGQLAVFGSPFILFLDELGFSKARIGFLFFIIYLCGVLASLATPLIDRAGAKRTFLSFWLSRKIVLVFLLAEPFVLRRFGAGAAFALLAVVLLVFALCRTFGETAWYSWYQEYVPERIRGQFSAVNSMASSLAAFAAVGFAGLIVGSSTGIGRYQLLIALGIGFGLLSIAFAAPVPGGAPRGGRAQRPVARTFRLAFRALPLKDANFLFFLGGIALATVATTGWSSFVPLFLKEQAGISSSSIVLLQLWPLLGGLASSYLWGWLADRGRSRAVLLASLALTAFVPVGLLLVPVSGRLAGALVILANLVWGVASSAWGIGSGKLLFVSVVRTDRKSEYLAAYYACLGLTGALSPLAGGWLLDLSRGLGGGSYSLFFILTQVLLLACIPLFLKVRH